MTASSSLSRARLVAILTPSLLLGGALLSQYVGGLYPCEMCMWQRWPHLVAALANHAEKPLAGYLPIRSEIDPVPVMAGHRGPVGVPVIPGAAQPLGTAGGCGRVRAGRR